MEPDEDTLMKAIVDTFRQYDLDGDGTISRDELAQVFTRIDPVFWTSEKIDDLMQTADENGDGEIGYSEFVAWLCNTPGTGSSDGWDDARVMATYNFSALFNRSNLVVFEAAEVTDVYRFGPWSKLDRAASICEAVDKTSKLKRRLRRVRKADSDPDILEEEVRALQLVDHPSIEKLFQVFEDEEQIYFVFDLLEGGRSLKEWLLADGIGTEHQSSCVARQLLRGVHHLHRNHVAHREIRPRNVIVMDGGAGEMTARLVNCAHAVRFVEGETWTERFGELFYMSPQMATGAPYSYLTDVWSLGSIIYAALCGYPPFVGEDDSETRRMLKTCPLCFPHHQWENIDPCAKELCTEMLVVEEVGRLSLQAACNHAWFEAHQRPFVFLDRRVLERMQQWSQEVTPSKDACKNGKVQRILKHVCAQNIDQDKVKQLRVMFEDLDEDGDGTLTFSEFRHGLEKSYIEFDGQSLKMLLEGLDAEGTARINYTGFLAASMDASLLGDDAACKAAFEFLDRDRSGFVSAQELQAALGACGGEIGADFGVGATMQGFDSNGDGLLDFAEFRALLLGQDVEEARRKDPGRRERGRRRRSVSDGAVLASPPPPQPRSSRTASDGTVQASPRPPPAGSGHPGSVTPGPGPRSGARPRRAGAGAR